MRENARKTLQHFIIVLCTHRSMIRRLLLLPLLLVMSFFIYFIRRKYVSFNTWQPYTLAEYAVVHFDYTAFTILMHFNLLWPESVILGWTHHCFTASSLCDENCALEYLWFKHRVELCWLNRKNRSIPMSFATLTGCVGSSVFSLKRANNEKYLLQIKSKTGDKNRSNCTITDSLNFRY